MRPIFVENGCAGPMGGPPARKRPIAAADSFPSAMLRTTSPLSRPVADGCEDAFDRRRDGAAGNQHGVEPPSQLRERRVASQPGPRAEFDSQPQDAGDLAVERGARQLLFAEISQSPAGLVGFIQQRAGVALPR